MKKLILLTLTTTSLFALSPYIRKEVDDMGNKVVIIHRPFTIQSRQDLTNKAMFLTPIGAALQSGMLAYNIKVLLTPGNHLSTHLLNAATGITFTALCYQAFFKPLTELLCYTTDESYLEKQYRDNRLLALTNEGIISLETGYIIPWDEYRGIMHLSGAHHYSPYISGAYSTYTIKYETPRCEKRLALDANLVPFKDAQEFEAFLDDHKKSVSKGT